MALNIHFAAYTAQISLKKGSASEGEIRSSDDMAFKIVHVRALCIGCGSCAAICSDFWELDKDGFSSLKHSKKIGGSEELELKEIACNQEAAELCPVNCIHIYKDGKMII
jgi:ferredoxin